ncbi:MAG: hypothetical protein ACTH58_08665 [Marinomonas foliarum]|uniref:Uncharacterized protein n=1 Tax=Marinomonas foliarum TaxID=491950 RepID=A0A368ZVE9_9GAMM|nr:hypothetical protein [Marinomonas foliarum]RCX00951.1 hypothetical protein DFP77_12027 [Marinomonas foliarum]
MTDSNVFYKIEASQITRDISFVNEIVLLVQKMMAKLFGMSKQNIGQYLNNIYLEQELIEGSVVRDFFTTATDCKQYRISQHNLDANIAFYYSSAWESMAEVRA